MQDETCAKTLEYQDMTSSASKRKMVQTCHNAPQHDKDESITPVDQDTHYSDITSGMYWYASTDTYITRLNNYMFGCYRKCV